MICPHVITEHAEDAVPYCQICAPQYIAALRARVAALEKVAVDLLDACPKDCKCAACNNARAALDAAKEGK